MRAFLIFQIILGLLVGLTAKGQKLGVIDSLERVMQKQGEDTNKVKLLNSLSYKLSDRDTTRSLLYGHYAITLSNKLNYKPGLANANNNIGLFYYDIGSYRESLKYFLTSLSFYEELKDLNGTAMVLSNIGNIYTDNGNFDTALLYQLQSLKIEQKLGKKTRLGATYNNLGLIYEGMAKFDTALQYYIKDLQIEEELGLKSEMSNSYNNVGNIHMALGAYDKALEYYQKAKLIRDSLGNKGDLGYTLNNMGNAYARKEDYKTALKYYIEALSKLEEIDNKKGIISCVDNIGTIYYYLKNYSEALRYLFKSKNLAEQVGNKVDIASSLINIAQVYADTKQYSAATKCYKEAINISMQVGSRDRLRDGYRGLSYNYVAMGDFRNGYEMFVRYTEVKDSILNNENNKNINDLQIKYDTEKKNRENAVLKRNEVINEARIVRHKNQKLILSISSLLIISAFGLLILYWRKRSIEEGYKANKLGLEKSLVQQRAIVLENEAILYDQENKIRILEVLNQHATNHEIKTLVKNIADYVEIKMNRFIRKDLPPNDTFKLNIEHIIHFSGVVSNYITKYYAYSKEIVTTVSREIDLSKEYAQAFQIVHLGEGYKINIINEIQNDYVLNDMHVPTHLLNNFIMNSLKHGLIGDEEEIQYVLDIKISALKTERGYAISIDDNGCGIEYTKSKKQNTRMESSGNDLAQNLIKVFNNFEGEEYLIVFSENQVFDKKHDLNDGKGTKVILQFIRKNIG